jgi:hypothetical protein
MLENCLQLLPKMLKREKPKEKGGRGCCCHEEAGCQEGGQSHLRKGLISLPLRRIQPQRDLTHFVKWSHYMSAVAKGYPQGD